VNTAGSLTTAVSNDGYYSFKAQIVYFDDRPESLRLPPYNHLGVNLMLPPENYTDLCNYPPDEVMLEMLRNDKTATTTNNTLPIDFKHTPIGLLVPLGRSSNHYHEDEKQTNDPSSYNYDCDLLTKVQVAIAIQQNITKNNQLWSVIFYNDNDDYRSDSYYTDNRVSPMGVESFWDSELIPGIDSLILATVSSSTGETILQQMIDEASLTDFESPQYIFNEGNINWRFGASLERAANAPFRGSRDNSMNAGDSGTDWGVYTFIWFRFILFAFIFCFPFVRIFRMWWQAGGRFQLRRNERGRIVGLRYQRPADNWLSGDNNRRRDRDPSAAPIRGRLSKEQVMALPEICYEGKSRDEDDAIALETDEQRQTSAKTDQLDVTVQMGNTDTTKDSSKSDENHDCISSGVEDNNVQSAASTSTSSSEELFTKTISTTCSICIEEFEVGEKIRLLPRCGHGFHTECILPWLSERQGCCPFCKSGVLDLNNNNEEDRARSDTDNQEEHQQNQRHDDEGQVHQQPEELGNRQ
jgi:hypothetical protein